MSITIHMARAQQISAYTHITTVPNTNDEIWYTVESKIAF